MKIVAPVSSVKEAEMLIQCGADELYCGIRTPEWEEHFVGRWWMNRRDPFSANMGSWNDIQEVVEQAHARDVAVYLTLNAPFYPEASIPHLLRLIEKLVREIRVDGFIVSDVNFLMLLAREKLPVRLHLSSLGSCFNSWAVDFYRSLSIERIILPRQLRLSEIGRLIGEANNEMEFEVFAVNDGCYFEEGFCQTTHAFGPFCHTDWRVEGLGLEGNGFPQEKVQEHLQKLHEYLWYQNNCGSSFQTDGLPNGPCSLCWFGHFRDWGVAAVKIIGREASFHRKMASLQLVKAVMDETRNGGSSGEIARTARALRSTPEYCEKGYMCYYRDL